MTWGLHVGSYFVLASCRVMVSISWVSFHWLCRLSYQSGHVHVVSFMLWDWPWVLLEVFPVQRVFGFHCIGNNFVCTPELFSCSCLAHGAVAIWALYFVDLTSLSARALPDTVLGGILPVPPCLKVVQHFFKGHLLTQKKSQQSPPRSFGFLFLLVSKGNHAPAPETAT